MKLSAAFTIKYGQKQFHNKENLDKGGCLLISSQATDNGCYGFFDIKPKYSPPFITVPSTGSIGHACVQLVESGVADDALVLTPIEEYETEYLFYVTATIRGTRWRYNYGRKITPVRLGNLEVIPPKQFKTSIEFRKLYKQLYPQKTQKAVGSVSRTKFKQVNIMELFELERGQFHAIDKLEPGTCPTISRVSTENGLVGFYKKPSKAIYYREPILTISTVTGDAFLQFKPFIATDNVLICKPRLHFEIPTLIYIQALINKVKWRYSYGRQPYKRIFQKTSIKLPVNDDNTPNQDYILEVIENQPYWRYFQERYS